MPWAIRHLPYYGRWYRFLLFWPACDGGLSAMRIDPDYPHQDRGDQRDQRRRAARCSRQWMVEQVGDDAELLAKVVPDYVCLGKRTLQDNGSWLGALTRDDVDLVTDPIVEIAPTGVVAHRRRRRALHEVDVIVYATGFHANRYLWPMDIVGRDGAVLGEQWGDEPTAYLGITVPNFPNLFCLYGPGHQPGPRRQPDLPLRVPGPLRDGLPGRAARRRPDARDRVPPGRARRLQRPPAGRARHDGLDATRRSAHSWYRNDDGRDLHPRRRGASSTTGPGPASPTSRSSTCAEPPFRRGGTGRRWRRRPDRYPARHQFGGDAIQAHTPPLSPTAGMRRCHEQLIVRRRSPSRSCSRS